MPTSEEEGMRQMAGTVQTLILTFTPSLKYMLPVFLWVMKGPEGATESCLEGKGEILLSLYPLPAYTEHGCMSSLVSSRLYTEFLEGQHLTKLHCFKSMGLGGDQAD